MESIPSGELDIIRQHIPCLNSRNTEIHLIDKGYSSDRKYAVKQGGQKYLLRTFSGDMYPRKKQEYEVLQKMKEYQVNCSRPLEIGLIEGYSVGYMLLSFVEGEDATEALPTYTEKEQYKIGLAAGHELRKMHQYQAQANTFDWHAKQTKKCSRYIQQYQQCGVKIKNDSKLLSFIEEHLDLMKGRPILFQHDDFHVGNLIVKEGQLAGVIDFNRYDWGDPIHDFLKTGMFSSEISIPFSVGQIHGYHHGGEPDETFWRLYSLYLAMCLVSSVPWIIRVKPEELDDMMDKINRVLEDHEEFTLMTPGWYMNYSEEVKLFRP